MRAGGVHESLDPGVPPAPAGTAGRRRGPGQALRAPSRRPRRSCACRPARPRHRASGAVERPRIDQRCGDVGQGEDELKGLEEKAKKTGAKSCKVVDVRREFLTDYVWPNLRAMSVYEGRYLLGTSMARPILAKVQVDYAREVGAKYVAHGCTGKGNDQVRFELTYQALAPDLEIIAPWREWDIRSREDAIDYAEARKIPITASRTKIYSRDRNLWHISHEGGALEDPANSPPDLKTLADAGKASAKPAVKTRAARI
jgi:argininosuccinate synthase